MTEGALILGSVIAGRRPACRRHRCRTWPHRPGLTLSGGQPGWQRHLRPPVTGRWTRPAAGSPAGDHRRSAHGRG
ncbi:MAG: hypothetical protein R2838_09755 [Caldilineaceae bacterium]